MSSGYYLKSHRAKFENGRKSRITLLESIRSWQSGEKLAGGLVSGGGGAGVQCQLCADSCFPSFLGLVRICGRAGIGTQKSRQPGRGPCVSPVPGRTRGNLVGGGGLGKGGSGGEPGPAHPQASGWSLPDALGSANPTGPLL